MDGAELGRSSENAAVDFLRNAGYRIIARNVRLPGGEVDIICRDGATMVFVEVKARRTRSFGSAISAVDARKRSRLRAAAADYVQFVAPGATVRFDVITAEHGVIRLHKGAFA